MRQHTTMITITWLVMCFLIPGCSQSTSENTIGNSTQSEPKQLQKVSLQLNWFPEAEHGGYYAALVHGYFKNEGLDVEILPGGPGSPVIQKLVARQTDFVIGNGDQVLTGRVKEADVVALFAPLQNSPRCIMLHKSSGIEKLEDLTNMTLALSAGRAFALYMQKKLPLENVKVVGYSGSISVFLNDPNFGQQGYVFSEPFTAKENGCDPKTLMVSDLGFNPYTSLLITSEELLAKEIELVEKMVRASKRGWQTYLKNPTKTNQYLHRLNGEMSMEILAFGAKVLKDLCLPNGMPEDQLGSMTSERWTQLRDQLVEIDLVPADLVPAEAFTNN